MISMSCENTVNSPLYVDTAPYGLNYGSGNYSNSSLVTHSNYVTLGGMTASDLMELCSIEKLFFLPKKNYTDKSFEEIHSDLAYGFELSWYNINCGKCRSGCYLDSADRRRCIGLLNNKLNIQKVKEGNHPPAGAASRLHTTGQQPPSHLEQ